MINRLSTCFGHHYAHRQENKTCKTACGVCLVVLAVVVWSWDVNSVHSVKVVFRLVESLLITNKHQITVTSSCLYYLPTLNDARSHEHNTFTTWFVTNVSLEQKKNGTIMK